MSKVSGMVADARRRWLETRGPVSLMSVRALTIEVPTLPIPSRNGIDMEYECLPYRKIWMTTSGGATWEYDAQRCFFLADGGVIILNARGHGNFQKVRSPNDAFDIEIPRIRLAREFSTHWEECQAEIRPHFEPLLFQRVKTFPKGWAASKWYVGKEVCPVKRAREAQS